MTQDRVKQSLRLKLKVTKTGFEATVKGDCPEEAVSQAVKAGAAMQAYKSGGYTPPVERPRNELAPVLVEASDTSAKLMAAGGTAGTYNATLANLAEDYVVKIELVRNTKGLGWEITVKSQGDTEEEVIANGMALLAETDGRLRELFPEVTGTTQTA